MLTLNFAEAAAALEICPSLATLSARVARISAQPNIVALQWLLGGFQLLALGVTGEYVVRIFLEGEATPALRCRGEEIGDLGKRGRAGDTLERRDILPGVTGQNRRMKAL
jgi:hypothetical protein